MKKSFWIMVVAMVTPLLSGCPSSGSSAPPPPWLPQTASDGRVKLEWAPTAGVDYWLFTASDPALSAFNWTSLQNAHAYTNVVSPFYMCGLINDLPYYFATNGRVNGGPGGDSSPTISAIPYNASEASHWNAGSVGTSTNINGIGYASLNTCSNNTISASGIFAAVGPAGAIFTSNDGQGWTLNAPPTSFSTDLYAVTGYTANQNNSSNPGLRLVAVGAGGASIYSIDGLGWNVGNPANSYDASTNPANPGNQALRAITQVSGTFFAVGDAGTILTSTDGITWTSHTATSGTTNNLNGVTHGGIFVAVGDNGTIVTSSDGNTWGVVTPIPSVSAVSIRQTASFVSSYGSIYVAVGDNGTIVTSDSYHGTNNWSAQTLTGSPNLVGITAETRAVDTTTATADPSLNFISTVQFVAVDSAGNAYTSVNGYTWSAAIPTGATSLNALVSSGFGYVGAGNSGGTAYAF